MRRMGYIIGEVVELKIENSCYVMNFVRKYQTDAETASSPVRISQASRPSSRT
jgi:hypothetical protein